MNFPHPRGSALLIALATLALCLLPAGNSYAQGALVGLDMFAVPDKFEVTLQSCQISSDGGSTFIDLFTTDMSMDVASGAADSKITEFVSGLALPAATYDLIRCVVSGTAVINGSITDTGTGTTYYTDPTVAGTQTGTTAPAQDITVSGSDLTVDLAISLVVAAGGAREVRIDFDLAEALELFDAGGGVRVISVNEDGFDVSITVVS